MLVMCTLSKGCLDIGSVPFGKHERVLLAFSVLLMTLLFPSPAHVVQGVLLGMLLLASRLPAGDPARFSELLFAKSCDLLDQVKCWIRLRSWRSCSSCGYTELDQWCPSCFTQLIQGFLHRNLDLFLQPLDWLSCV